ncbi:The fantastic four family - like 4 [Theobroma cacao]|uniref:Structural constituent of ribosome, putative n=1 Tax=Theobroma cacao TaxID=3641 RepID=A0A061FNJ7_THECC|nr:Structural constituent of ribosome, putative [Theobroma cacao]WRX29962.1 The fantastic four family - like 4 [Theobroma cacao]
MQPQKYYSASSSEIQLRLETLTICPKKSQTEKHFNSCMIASSVVSSSPSSLIGDYIGTESCFDLDKSEEVCVSKTCDGGHDVNSNDCSGVCDRSRGKREQRRKRMKREFPPPIPSLASTANQFSHMPWVLRRYYTSDGRLILREEKVRHQEYFRAHRSNGRLTLHLVPLDENDLADHHPIDGIEDCEIDHEEAKEEVEVNVFDININNDDEDDKSNIVETLVEDNDAVIEDSIVKCSSMAETPMENGIAANGGKCLNYSSVRASPTCFLGLPVPAIRPVHS